jgi:hypothetical protein
MACQPSKQTALRVCGDGKWSGVRMPQLMYNCVDKVLLGKQQCWYVYVAPTQCT